MTDLSSITFVATATLCLLLLLVAVTKAYFASSNVLALRQDLLELRKYLSGNLRLSHDDNLRNGREQREELSKSLSTGFQQVGQLVSSFGSVMHQSFEQLGAAQKDRLEHTIRRLDEFGEKNDANFSEFHSQTTIGRKLLRDEIAESLKEFRELVGHRFEQSAEYQRERLENVTTEIRRHSQLNTDLHDKLKQAVEGRLDHLRTENSLKLDEMRLTVDEKLQGTLERRLGDSFKRVDEQLKQVHESVGKMQDLAVGVGDLKRLFGNVKLRGGWAEVSLGNLLDQVLTAEQYLKNVAVDPNSDERVEFAIKLPGQGNDDKPCWLPIDAKFPVEDYERLLQASERGDADGVEGALKGLETRVRREAATICKKYVRPPHTTDFGIMFLPTEGLYAEVIRRPGLVDDLQRDCQIVVAGPTVLMALLSSLRMGFKTLAIQKKSSEVWKLLGDVKSEFASYGGVLDKVKKKLDDASATLDKDLMVRTRAVNRSLRDVEILPEHQPQDLASLPFLAVEEKLQSIENDELADRELHPVPKTPS